MYQNLAKTIVIGISIAGLSFVAGVLVTGEQLMPKKPIVRTALSQKSGAELVPVDVSPADRALNNRQLLAGTSKDSNGRIILNAELLSGLRESCLPEVDTKINLTSKLHKNKTVQFIDTQNGVKFPVQYNDGWLGDSFALAPYSLGSIDADKVIEFGAPINYQLCAVTREFGLYISDFVHTSSDSIVTTKTIGNRVFVVSEEREQYIATDLQVVSYSTTVNGHVFEFTLTQEGQSETFDKLHQKMEAFLKTVTFFDPSTIAQTDFFSGETSCSRGYYKSSKQMTWYENNQYGFGLWVPTIAGTEDVPPYEVTTTPQGVTMGFGDAEFINAEGCAAYRQYHLTPIPSRIGEQIKDFALQTTGDIAKRVTNDREVWSYYEPVYTCHQLVYEIVGQAYNYKITEQNHCSGWHSPDDGAAGMAKIVDNVIVFGTKK